MIVKNEYQPSYIAVANKTIYYKTIYYKTIYYKTIYYNSGIYSCKMWLY